eukprot:TRINITY_DN294_c0_g1_i4.p1 TRINITY_DN294_c0_g1~~TRINITY_DN294_c0_g1_i4.p1  ORF type:complete len:263 (-),score=72.23 TRINITY_DN294_c0_g1_i4:107-895(-)
MDVQNLFSVKGKVVLVTGGSRGVGLGIVRGFVANGAKVYISARGGDVATKVAEELTKQGPGSCIAIPMDIATEDNCRELANEIAKHEKELHVLVNNAGAAWGDTLEEYPDKAWDKLLAINLKSVFHLTKFCLPLLKAAAKTEDPARVINIGSVEGLSIPAHETYAYSASKAAVHHLSRVLAAQIGHHNITVNCIAAGPFESKMMAHTLSQFKDVIIDSLILPRIGTPEDLAGISLFLSSRAGAWVTGTILTLDGGMTTKAKL